MQLKSLIALSRRRADWAGAAGPEQSRSTETVQRAAFGIFWEAR